MIGLTRRCSEPLAAVKSTFDSMKSFSMFVALAAASDGSAPSRYGNEAIMRVTSSPGMMPRKMMSAANADSEAR